MKGHYKPGEHYTAVESEDRIPMPNLPELHGLRHCWCWEKRKRPHLPTWSFAKVPRLQFSPEENARLHSIYMRARTLRESESTQYNPLLSLLGKCEKREENMHPLWLALPPDATGSAQDAAIPRPLKRRMQRKDADPYKYRDKIKKREDSESNKKKGTDEGRENRKRSCQQHRKSLRRKGGMM